MSDPLRIALVAEGPTDRIVIEAALGSILTNRPYVLQQLQPEGSLVFGEIGTGWVGVYKWCKQSVLRGKGQLSTDSLVFQNYDMLLLHIDADVAGYEYASGAITPEPTDGALPCELPCPPAAVTTNALRSVLLSWCGETSIPAHTVVCMPSKSTEAWVVAALFPHDISIQQGIECYADPESRLGQQPKNNRIRKKQRDYESRSLDIEKAWPRIVNHMHISEAMRFQTDILAAI